MTMLYRATDRLCRCGAPVKNLAHSASFESLDKNAPSKSGTKQLGYVDLRVEDCREAGVTKFYAWLRKGAERLAPDELQNPRLGLMNIVVELADQSRQISDSPLTRLAFAEAELRAAKDMLADVRQSREDWKSQAERLAIAAQPLAVSSAHDQQRPWWRRLVG